MFQWYIKINYSDVQLLRFYRLQGRNITETDAILKQTIKHIPYDTQITTLRSNKFKEIEQQIQVSTEHSNTFKNVHGATIM